MQIIGDIKVKDFIKDMAEKGKVFHFDNGQETITVENMERLTVFKGPDGKFHRYHELGRVSGVIRGKKI